MGLILGIDGVLKGTPTAKGSDFQVCVKDVSGKSACRIFRITVNSASDNSNRGSGGQNNCPATPKPSCHSISNGIETTGVLTYAYCNCPSGTTFAQMDNTAAGGPYKICTCN